jgi:hypothetical protein
MSSGTCLEEALEECVIADKRMEDALWKVGRGDAAGIRETRKAIWRRLLPSSQCMEWVSRAGTEQQFLANNILEAVPSFGPEGIPIVQEIAEACAERLDKIPLRRVAEHALRAHSRSDVHERLRNLETRILQVAPPHSDLGQHFLVHQSYSGYVCAAVFSPSGELLVGRPQHPKTMTPLPPRRHCILHVWMSPSVSEDVWSDEVSVAGSSSPLGEVVFGFEVDCATMRFPIGRKRRWFDPKKKSEPVIFDFVTSSKPARHQLYIHVLQGDRIVASLFILLAVARESPRPPKWTSKEPKRPISK